MKNHSWLACWAVALLFCPIVTAGPPSGPDAMVPVEGGRFVMQTVDWQGAPSGLAKTVAVSRFSIARDEVTLELWSAVRTWACSNGYELAAGAGCASNHPVQKINWHDAVKWCNARSEMEGLAPAYTVRSGIYRTGQADLVRSDVDWNAGYRLPTEAEWEFAARGGVESRGFIYSGSDEPGTVAWYVGNSSNAPCDMVAGHGTWPVGLKAPNELGLRDMSGNVWEWCWDWRGDYEGGEEENPVGPSAGTYRVARGGGWMAGAPHCRTAFRNGAAPVARDCIFGLRPVLP